MAILRGLIGLITIGAIAVGFSYDRQEIKHNLKNIVIQLAIMLVLAFVFLKTNVGLSILTAISSFFSWLIDQGKTGVAFSFGGIVLEQGANVFFFHVLLPLVFMSALIGILEYTGVLSFFVKWIGKLVNKITGMGELESYMPIAATLLGSPQVFMTIADQLPRLNKKQLFTVALPAIAVANITMVAPYLTMVTGEYVVVAYFLNIFAVLVIAAIVAPQTDEEKTLAGQNFAAEEVKEKEPFFTMLGAYMTNGMNIAIAVLTMMIGFIGLINLLNNGFDAIIGITFTEIMGYVFAPIAFLLGVPSEDIIQDGAIMATKLFSNEFVAMGELSQMTGLTEKSVAMISTYLVGFANLGTFGGVSAAITAINKKQATAVGAMAIKLILAGTLASALTATIVGFFF
ncbi:nucleoside transport protein [Aerococcus urinaehominis]|nr:nucleoside transporter C-terminal domain-containing protein [Aerococcus urinaehominis]SDL81821.1 nucleoside transport protein [Aerococcus urinaehominis]